MRIIKHSAIVFGTDIIDTILVLARNVALARLLSLEQFGLAATFSILQTMAEASVNAGLNRMIVQARDADCPRVQATFQMVQVLLGILSSLIIALASWPFALAMGTTDLWWAYLLFALVPFIRGCGHLDPFRLQRHNKFGPSAVRQLLPQFMGLLSIFAFFQLLHDYRTVLFSMIMTQVLVLVASHAGAERPYRLGLDRVVFRRALTFGWPVMVNGIFMFLVLNGDRMVVSNRFGAETLGAFSAAFMLVMMPVMVISRSLQSVLLPRMSHAQDDQQQLQGLFDSSSNLTMFLAVCFVIGTALFGKPILYLLFGHKFDSAVPYLQLLAIMQGIRLARAAPAIVAMSRAETRNALYANIVRALFIPASLATAVFTGNIYGMLVIGLVGEIFATLTAAYFVQYKARMNALQFLIGLFTALLTMAAVTWTKLGHGPIWIVLPPLILFLFSVRGLLSDAFKIVRPDLNSPA